MICPECGAEYEDGVAECDGCDVALVDGGEDEIEEVDFSPLVESTDVTFFSLATARLEEAGIPWFVQGETSRGALPRDGGDARGPGDEVVTIYVAENRFDEARQLVRDLDPVEAGSDD
jgi:putative signal transducing protein